MDFAGFFWCEGYLLLKGCLKLMVIMRIKDLRRDQIETIFYRIYNELSGIQAILKYSLLLLAKSPLQYCHPCQAENNIGQPSRQNDGHFADLTQG